MLWLASYKSVILACRLERTELRSAQASPPALEVTTGTGILLMGAHLYSTVTGLFTSLDSVHGGNDTPYTYPNDPINKQDLTGQKWSWRKAFKSFRRAAHNVASSRVFRFVQGVCGFTWGSSRGRVQRRDRCGAGSSWRLPWRSQDRGAGRSQFRWWPFSLCRCQTCFRHGDDEYRCGSPR